MEEVEGCGDLLLDRPYIGKRVGEFRRFPLGKFPFTLIHALEDYDFVVVAVSHHRRRRGYWMGRDIAANQSLQPTANPLRGLSAAELGR